MDPQQRLLLTTVVHALEDALLPPSFLKGRKVGVFVGAFSHDYEWLALGEAQREQRIGHGRLRPDAVGKRHGASRLSVVGCPTSVMIRIIGLSLVDNPVPLHFFELVRAHNGPQA